MRSATLIKRAMRRWRVPGLAVGAVAEEGVVHALCYGRRDASVHDAVTPRTRFAIGSLTKPFTATTIARLVEAGLLSWDVPVWRYLPEFRLQDPIAGAEATLRDLLSHRTGLPEHELTWYGRGPTLRDIPERLRAIAPTAPFRSRWQYQNMAFAVAAVAASRVAGLPWPELVMREVLRPLGLQATSFLRDLAPAALDGMAATPHLAARCGRGARRRVPWRSMEDGLDPVGGMVSCLDDMLVFLRFHLSGGVHEGRRVLSGAVLGDLHRAQILVEAPGLAEASAPLAHGLGFFVSSHLGGKIVTHTGSFDGFHAVLSLLPHAGIGCVALSNLGDENPVPHIAAAVLRDLLLGESPERWFDEIASTAAPRSPLERAPAGNPAAPPDAPCQPRRPPPSHPMKEYVGRYAHPGYGDIAITRGRTRGRLAFVLNGQERPLRPLHHDVFLVADDPPALSDARIMFAYDLDGRIDRLGVRPGAGAPLVWFTRVATVG
ncbi:serine hydrolase [Belnapia moabensis]|uniref:serine hydrolase n=1 Tax=Belnapia moabensis TaxID=365533 RepID=UPI001470452E|nr:serine hydrolase [Belnapia moabensis]